MAAALLALPLALAACGKKGDPVPPARVVPQTVSDLALRQRGDRVLLEFTHPKTTAAGLPLAGLASVTLLELTRPVPPAGQPVTVLDAELAGAVPVVELAGESLAAALVGDRVRVETALPSPAPEPPVARVYAVRTRAIEGELSGFSNRVALVPEPAPPAPEDLEVRAEKSGVALSWTAPAGTVAGYAVYRRPADSADWGAPLAIVPAAATWFTDGTARYGARYVYTVLALARTEPPIESAPRAEREIDYRDRFPPEVPTGLRAVALPAAVRLLWEASPDIDLAGYQIERAVGAGEWAPVGKAAILGLEYSEAAPAASGETVRYRVVAIDREGNVSAPSAEAEVRLP
jgi:fibronectin type 3 domain-containing protein/predicted small lipoprotein YifL